MILSTATYSENKDSLPKIRISSMVSILMIELRNLVKTSRNSVPSEKLA